MMHMKIAMAKLFAATALVAVLAGATYAQYDPCNIPPGEYRTYTRGGWRANCHGGNGGCCLDHFFAATFPSGLTVGGTHTMHFTSAAAVRAYLFDSRAAGVLAASHVNPTTTSAGTFGCQVVALALNIGYSDAGIPGFGPDLSSLMIHTGVHDPADNFFGWTVGQVFALANQVLGGDRAALPARINLSHLNTVISTLNATFDEGTQSTGYLVEPACLQGELHLVVLPTDLECVAGEYAPTPLPLRVEVHNTGNGRCTNIGVQLTDGAGIGGTATIQPPNPQTIANLAAGTATILTFTAACSLNHNGGRISFSLTVTCDDCPGFVHPFEIDVPVCPPPCVPDDHVLLVPVPPFPSPQNVTVCAHLSYGINTYAMVEVPVEDETNLPVIVVTPGCQNCGDPACEPLSAWVLGPWTFVSAPPRYVATLSAAEGAVGCCVSVHLDYILPVELHSFTATAADASVVLCWKTASERSNSHFEVARDGRTVHRAEAVNSPTGSTYVWEDRGLTNGKTYTYLLSAVSLDGDRRELRTVSATPLAGAATVREYALYQNCPNPFNPTTEIRFDLPEAVRVQIKIYNTVGQEMSTLLDESRSPGSHCAIWDGKDAWGVPVAAGVYIYQIKAGGFVDSKKMVLIK